MLNQKYISSIKHGGLRSFVEKATELGVSIKVIFEQPRVLELNYKGKVVFCVGDCVPIFKRSSNVATVNKAVTKAILTAAGLSTPRGILATTYVELKKKMGQFPLAYPLIAKPLDQSFAHGVTWNIQSEKELRKAVSVIQETSLKPTNQTQAFLVEEMAPGEEYRVLAFNGSIISCVKKVPATIVGDGSSSIEQLITVFNKKRLPGFEIRVDATVKSTLQDAGLTLKSVLEKNTTQKLRNNLNMSDGGRSIECTADLSLKLQRACLKSLEVLSMNYGGIDIITPSISDPAAPYVILEVNPLPYYNMHEKPLVEGRAIDVSGILLKEIFPSLKIKKG